MTFAADIASDCTLFDGSQSVVFQAQNPLGAEITVAESLRRAIQKRDVELVAGTVGVDSDVVVWHLPAENLSGSVPQSGDTITAGADVWRILSVSTDTLSSRYRAVCSKQR